MLNKCMYTLIALSLHFSVSTGQQMINSGGKSENAGAYQLSWSVGETLIATYSGLDNSLTQGFHQPSPKEATTILDNIKLNNRIVNIYPNPTAEGLNVEFESPSEIKSVYLFNLLGDKLNEFSMSDKSILIDLSPYNPGIYLLKISFRGGDSQINKIIKR